MILKHYPSSTLQMEKKANNFKAFVQPATMTKSLIHGYGMSTGQSGITI